MTRALTVTTTGIIAEVEVRDLTEYQRAVAGYIEPITLPTGSVMYVNEEGRMRGLERNPVAERLAGMRPIVGDVILTGPTNRNGDDTDIPDSEITRVRAAVAWIYPERTEQ